MYSQVLLRARAIENQCFVLAAAQVGQHHEKRQSYGHALVVDPWGEVLGDCGGEKPGMVLVEIDLEKIRSIRRNMPVQQHRRDASFYQSLEKTWQDSLTRGNQLNRSFLTGWISGNIIFPGYFIVKWSFF